MRTLSTFILALSTATFAGLAEPAQAQEMENAGTLTVQNNRDAPVTVYVEGELGAAQGPAREVRIGMVGPLETEQIEMPAWAAAPDNTIRAFLHVEGGPDLATEEFPARPGTMVGTIIAAEGDPQVRTLPDYPLREGYATVTVQNNRDVPVTVFVREEVPLPGVPRDTRIAIVPPVSTTEVALPVWVQELEDEVEFVLHPAAGVDLISEAVNLDTDSRPQLLIPQTR